MSRQVPVTLGWPARDQEKSRWLPSIATIRAERQAQLDCNLFQRNFHAGFIARRLEPGKQSPPEADAIKDPGKSQQWHRQNASDDAMSLRRRDCLADDGQRIDTHRKYPRPPFQHAKQ